MTPISLTALRSQLFKIVDRVIETGMPVEIERKGHKLKIVLEEKKSKLDNLQRRKCIVGDPDDLIDLEVGEWKEGANLYCSYRRTRKYAKNLPSDLVA